ncbi:MAG: autotransporter outer membrane beta-barrel domain-containing protein [Verrucomicrobiales bacterium]|jgi:outer membrane autotransporter protein|nr:autotransporter outer membrane beta-barrel domain-containing protein [Verrucomicrobiales bacterium]
MTIYVHWLAKSMRGLLVTAYCLLLLAGGTMPALADAGPLVADGTSVTAADGETYTAWQVSNGGLLTSGSGNVINGTVGVFNGTVSARDFRIEAADIGAQLSGNNSTALLSDGTIVSAGNWGMSAYVSATIIGERLQVTTAGAVPAVVSKWGGHIELTDSALTSQRGDGVQIISGGGYLKLTNVTINCAITGVRLTAGVGTADLANVTVVTTGAASAYGIQADTGSTINARNLDLTTSGNQSRAIYAAMGSDINLSGTIRVTTSGADAHGLLARYANNADYPHDTRIIAAADSVLDITINGGNLLRPSSGVQASAVSGDLYRSYIELNGITNVTVSESARGYGLCSSGSNTHIRAAAGAITTRNTRGYGIYSISAGSVDAANFIINSTGDTGHGVAAALSGSVTLRDSTVTTAGAGASALYTSGGLIDGRNLQLTTAGDNAHALYAASSGTVTLRDSTVSATGSTASALYADDGAIDGRNLDLTSADGSTVRLQDSATVTLTAATLRNTGTGPAAQLAVTDTHRAALTLTNSAITSGGHGFVIDHGTADSALTVNLDHVTLATGPGRDALQVSDAATVTLTANHSTLTGNLTASGDSTATVNLTASTLTGMTTLSDNAKLHLALHDNANWNLTGPAKLTTLSAANGAAITIDHVLGDDLTVSHGISGQTNLNLTLADSVKGQEELRVIADETGAMPRDAFILGREVSAGMYQYLLDNRDTGAWLIYTGTITEPVIPPIDPPAPPAGPLISSAGDAVLNTAAAVSGFWFTQQDHLHKRLGELRAHHPVRRVGGTLVENIWVRGYGQHANIHTGFAGIKGFSEIQYGVDLGTDKAWSLGQDNTLYTGLFAGYGGADRDFHTGYEGRTDSGYGGLYGTWLHQDGWYADAVAKGQYFNTSFDGDDHGSYHSYGVGLSLELGRQFQFQDGWFIEPSLQASYLHLMNDNYTTTQGLAVNLGDADIIQFHGGARFGRNIQLNDSGWLQPYLKVGGIEQLSAGGRVNASDGEWRPNVDGARGVIGAGIVYQLDAANQLHLDYEASFGAKYDQPWGLNLGYRHQF